MERVGAYFHFFYVLEKFSRQKDLNDLVFENLEEYLNKTIYRPNLFNGAFSGKHRHTLEILQVPFQTTRTQQVSK